MMTMLTAITLCVIVQWLLGKCTKRNKAQSTPTEKSDEEEESEDFEIVSEPEEATERVAEEQIEAER